MAHPSTIPDSISKQAAALAAELAKLDVPARVEALNAVREALHAISPFRSEPVDFVRWVPAAAVVANDYNPNSVARPEMALLHDSIREDGYTQPIVTVPGEAARVVVDGFHRHRVGREKADIRERVHGYLPVVSIEKPLEDRMASTIRHNRARGKHQVELMGELVRKLVGMGLSDGEIAKRLGMEGEEVLRLRQNARAAEVLANKHYGRSWTVAADDR